MLAIMATDSEARTFFSDMQKTPTARVIQQSKQLGDGLGKNSKFWAYMAMTFNDKNVTPQFPWDHKPQNATLSKRQGSETIIKIIKPPTAIQNGIFEGLKLMSALRPANFAPDFFTAIELKKACAAGFVFATLPVLLSKHY